MTDNPYTNRTTLYDEDDFYGRFGELKDMFGRVVSGQSFSLVGERRVGKSSLLQALNFPTHRARLDIGDDLLVLHVDLQYLAGCSEEEFVEFLIEEAEDAFELEVEAEGRGALRELAREVVRERGCRLAITLDEFDVLLNNERISPEFFALLRAWANQYQIAYVGASKESEIEGMVETTATGSPFLNTFGRLYISTFTAEEAEQLILEPADCAGSEFDDADVERVVRLAGYHPYYLQVACFHLFELKALETPTEELDHQLEQRFSYEAMDNMRYLFNRLSADEMRALRSFALSPTAGSEKALYDLKRKGILIRRHDKWRLFSRTFAELLHSEIATQVSSRDGLQDKVDADLL